MNKLQMPKDELQLDPKYKVLESHIDEHGRVVIDKVELIEVSIVGRKKSDNGR